MAVGQRIQKSDIDNAISGYATQLHQIKRSLADMRSQISGMTDPDFAALGYSPEDITALRRYFSALGNMLLNLTGKGVIADGVNAPKITIETAKYMRFGV